MEFDDNNFTNGEINVAYNPKKCIHAGSCCKGLSEVFKESVIPWVDLGGAPSQAIVSQIQKCPSGALTWEKVSNLQEVS